MQPRRREAGVAISDAIAVVNAVEAWLATRAG